MVQEKKCVYHRKTENPVMGSGIGYCDLGVAWVLCEGDIKFCEEPEALIRNFYVEWGKNRAKNIPSLPNKPF